MCVGDTIALVAPAGPVDPTRVDRAVARLEAAGFRIKTFGDLHRQRGYLAGDDQARTEEFNAAIRDDESVAIIPARGGYGMGRILDQLDYDALARRPKLITGFSDITALHAAVGQRIGLVTFHSPNPQDGIGRGDGLSELSARTFWRAVLAEGYAAGDAGYEIPLTDAEQQQTITLQGGVARGPIAGGNLAVLSALEGTPYELQAAGTILLIEDIGEQPYRIDRYLCQLRLSGKLEQLAGVLIGQLTDCTPEDGKPSLSLDDILLDYFAPLGLPVLTNYPIGHARDNATIPLGIEAELDADKRTVRVLKNPVELRGEPGGRS